MTVYLGNVSYVSQDFPSPTLSEPLPLNLTSDGSTFVLVRSKGHPFYVPLSLGAIWLVYLTDRSLVSHTLTQTTDKRPPFPVPVRRRVTSVSVGPERSGDQIGKVSGEYSPFS